MNIFADNLLDESLLPDLDVNAVTEGTVSFPTETGLQNENTLKSEKSFI